MLLQPAPLAPLCLGCDDASGAARGTSQHTPCLGIEPTLLVKVPDAGVMEDENQVPTSPVVLEGPCIQQLCQSRRPQSTSLMCSTGLPRASQVVGRAGPHKTEDLHEVFHLFEELIERDDFNAGQGAAE
jgi:hypothetical protein